MTGSMSKKASQSFASADAKALLYVFCRDMCVAENTLRGVSVELSAISGQQRRRTQRSFLEKVAKPLFRQSRQSLTCLHVNGWRIGYGLVALRRRPWTFGNRIPPTKILEIFATSLFKGGMRARRFVMRWQNIMLMHLCTNKLTVCIITCVSWPPCKGGCH